MKVTVSLMPASDSGGVIFNIETDEPADNHPMLDQMRKEALEFWKKTPTSRKNGQDTSKEAIVSQPLSTITLPGLVTDLNIKQNVVSINLAFSITSKFKLPDDRMDNFLAALGLSDLPKNVNKLAGSELDLDLAMTAAGLVVEDFHSLSKGSGK